MSVTKLALLLLVTGFVAITVALTSLMILFSEIRAAAKHVAREGHSVRR